MGSETGLSGTQHYFPKLTFTAPGIENWRFCGHFGLKPFSAGPSASHGITLIGVSAGPARRRFSRFSRSRRRVSALADMADLDKGIARRVKKSVERFAETGAGNVKRLQDIDPPEFRLRVGDYRVRFHQDNDTMRILRVRNRREAYR